jgi:hypothetical protein
MPQIIAQNGAQYSLNAGVTAATVRRKTEFPGFQALFWTANLSSGFTIRILTYH